MLETKRTAKAIQTREHILKTALGLFAEKGYEETTLREIAGAAKVSLGLTYRYFSSKEKLVLALYEQLSNDAVASGHHLERGTVATRFGSTLNRCLDGLAPHRNTMSSLFSVGLNPRSELAVLGPGAAELRNQMWGLYRCVVSEATDAPKDNMVDQMATLLYAGHLLTMLFWLQDQSEGQQRTRALVKFAEGLLKRLRPVMGLPIFVRSIGEIGQIIGPVFGPTR